MNYKSLIIFFLAAGTALHAQTPCFSDCKQRSLAAWENLQKKGITSTDSALSCDQKITGQLKGCQFPNVTLNKLDGGTFKIDELKGNVVFVHLWFVNCATCIAEMPMINKLNAEYADQPVKFLFISFDDQQKLLDFFKRKGASASIQTFMDQQTLESTFCLLSGYPMNFILDKNGKVMEVWTEENPEADKQEGFYNKVKSLIGFNLK